VVFPAGAVGLLAAHSARLRGGAQVYSVDAIPERLDKAGELGAIRINFIRQDQDTVELIREHRSKWRTGPAFWRKNPLCEVTCAIDAIGFHARAETDCTKQDPLWAMQAIAELVNLAVGS